MSRFTTRTWNIPQVSAVPAPRGAVRDREDCDLTDGEVLDPGPTGLVAARIQLFDQTSGRSPDRRRPTSWLLEEGAPALERGNRTLGYQARKLKKNIPEHVTLSRHQPLSSGGLLDPEGAQEHRGRTRLSAIFNPTPGNKESGTVEKLYQKLASFSLYGLPRLPEKLRAEWGIREGEESRIHLPNSWRDIVKGHE
ncbi:pleckstrin homology domain-containing family G member 6-like, partial [Carcharodon carcharias]|uniref:pleckstrin homology domain-containing family G member 6-like n=1 Tax=Carcharodon carcharias TaxID=13397 RepID=UPI001B7F1ED3